MNRAPLPLIKPDGAALLGRHFWPHSGSQAVVPLDRRISTLIQAVDERLQAA